MERKRESVSEREKKIERESEKRKERERRGGEKIIVKKKVIKNNRKM